MSLKAKDLRNESKEELQRKIKDLQDKYLELKFNHVSGTLKNPHELNSIRKDIARIMTIIGEKNND
ncbi:MAG: 50S ribosomal protein L29 [Elusimicrobia bacterium]|nr:50S ribosomal protein L29 [Elusimicrobiota bacterium]